MIISLINDRKCIILNWVFFRVNPGKVTFIEIFKYDGIDPNFIYT